MPMPFNLPSFWYKKKPTLSAYGLLPLAWMVQGGGWLRQKLALSKTAPIPVICVGNLTVGGAGKTPTVLKLGEMLKAQGHSVHFLTRGYGGRLQGVVRVSLKDHTYQDVGDEALLLAQCAPTWVSADRYAGAREAAHNGADVIVMDDGFQNPTLYKDFSLLVIDGKRGFGNGFILPAGPLRESISQGLSRANALIIIGENEKDCFPQETLLPQIKAALLPTSHSLKHLKQFPLVAFCGIDNPLKFFSTLKESAFNVIQTRSFPDHYPYQPQDLKELLKLAEAHQSKLVTTRKDWVRLPQDFRKNIEVLDITLEFEDIHQIQTLLKKTLGREIA